MKTATADIGQLQIMFRTHGEISQAVCVLCGQPSLVTKTGVGLYDGGVHRGDLCKLCLRGGKRGAASRTRSYLVELRHLAEQCTLTPDIGGTRQFREWLHRYADFLEDLAGRLDGMSGWIPRLE